MAPSRWIAVGLLALVSASGAAWADTRTRIEHALRGFPAERHDRTPLVRLWTLLDLAFAAQRKDSVLQQIPVPDAAVDPQAGERSAAKILVPPESLGANFALWAVAKRIEQRLADPPPPVQACANGQGDCCYKSPYAECVRTMRPSGEGLFARAERLQAVSTVVDLLAIELAGNSFFLSEEDISAGKLPSGMLAFAWPYQPTAGGRRILFTKLDAALLDRLAGTLTLAADAVADAVPREYVCRDGRLYAAQVTGATVFNVSTGQPSSRRRPPATAAKTSAVAVSVAADKLGITFRQGPGFASFQPRQWDELLQAALDTGAFRSCLNQAAVDFLAEQPGVATQLRNSEASSFLFYSLYLSALWDHLGSVEPR